MSAELDGLVALVTGGASGIGAATADLLAGRGARVGVLDREPDVVDARHLAIRCDVSDDAQVRQAVATVVERLGRLDIVVNNAGMGAQGTVEDNDDDEWQRTLQAPQHRARRRRRDPAGGGEG